MSATPPPWNAGRFEKAKELFLDVLERPEGERAAFLVVACHGDDALRTEVESLLGYHEPAAPTPRAGAPAFVAGNLVADRYRPREKFGEIAGCQAWTGWDLLDDRDVTLVLLLEPDKKAQSALEARLRRASPPMPPSVVPVFDVAARRDGLAVILGAVPGEALEDSPRAPGTSSPLFLDDLLAGMAAIHSRGHALGGLAPGAVRVDANGRGAIVPIVTAPETEDLLRRDLASIERLGESLQGSSSATSPQPAAAPLNIFELAAWLEREPLAIAALAGLDTPAEAFCASRIRPRLGRASILAAALAGLAFLPFFPKAIGSVPGTFIPAALAPLALLLALVASEPILRRRRPRLVIGWQRAQAGRFANSLVASELALGVLAGEMGAAIGLAQGSKAGSVAVAAALLPIGAALAAGGLFASIIAAGLVALFLLPLAPAAGFGAFAAAGLAVFAIVVALRSKSIVAP